MPQKSQDPWYQRFIQGAPQQQFFQNGMNIGGATGREPWYQRFIQGNPQQAFQNNMNIGGARAGAGAGGSGRSPSFNPANTLPSLRGLSLADLYGIDYDETAIRARFDEGTKAQYAMLDKQHQTTENKFYDQMYGNQSMALDAIRRSNAEAVATGASRGIQAANQLSAILGTSQESVAGATELAQERNLLKDKEAAAYMQNIIDAMQESNQLRQATAGIDANLYAADTQHAVGQMDYYASLNAAQKQYAGMMAQAQAQIESTKMSSESQERIAALHKDPDFNETVKTHIQNHDWNAIQTMLIGVGVPNKEANRMVESYKKEESWKLFFERTSNFLSGFHSTP